MGAGPNMVNSPAVITDGITAIDDGTHVAGLLVMTTRLRQFVLRHVALWALVAVQGIASDPHEEVNPNPACHVDSDYDANDAEPEFLLNRICNAPDDLVTLEGVWIVDTSTVFSGGVNTSAWANHSLVELALGIDPGRLLEPGVPVGRRNEHGEFLPRTDHT